MRDKNFTELERANFKLESAKIAIAAGAKVDITKSACLEVAKKIYEFVIGTTEQSAPGTK